jgi:DNA-binding PadR family transcriptional regulator
MGVRKTIDSIVGKRYSRIATMRTAIDKTSPLSPATLHILLALAGGDLHGYGIIQEVARHSEGHYRLGPGTLYDNLKKMMDGGLVVDAPSAADAGDERRFYRLTVDGGSVLAAEVDRLERVVEEARLRLQGRREEGV